MNLLFHHLRKDLRFARWLILATLFVSAAILWFPTVPLEERRDQMIWLAVARYGGWLLAFLTAGHLIQMDAPLREGGYLRTRPASRSTVIQSKMVAVLILIVPLAAIECLLILLLGLKPGATNLLLIFAENLLALAMICSVGMAMAIRKESAAKFNASVVLWIGIAVIGWLAFIWGRNAYFQTGKTDWGYALEYLKTSRLLMAQVVSLMGLMIGIALFACGGRSETVNRSLAITAVCALAALFLWPLNFVETFAPPAREAPRSEWLETSNLKVVYEEQPYGRDGKSIFRFSDGVHNDTRYRRVDALGRISGPLDGWEAAHQNSYQSTLKLTNGKSIFKSSQAWAGLSWHSILPQLEIPSHYSKDEKQIRQFELTEFELEKAVGAMTGAHLRGTTRIHLKRPVILARIPLRKGASQMIDGRRITITNVVNSSDEVTINFVIETELVHLRGGWQKIWVNRFEHVIIHPQRREYLNTAGSGGSNLRSWHYSVQDQQMTARLEVEHRPVPIPEDWIDGAELLVIGNENGGSFSQTFDFPNINLSHEQ